jgi:ribose transport system substrate-binding protein
MLKSIGFAGVCVLAMLAVGCGSKDSTATSTTGPSASGGGNGTPRLQIAVIPKGTTHAYWKSLEAGARQAGADLNVDILYKGPLKEDDRAGQIAVVQQFTSDKVDAIVLAPLDSTALARPVAAAKDAKIPVVIIDSALDGQAGTDFVSLVATDNKLGGRMAGEQMAKILGGKGKVIMIRYMVGSASTTDRESGFLDVIKTHPDITVISDDKYGGATEDETEKMALTITDLIGTADGIYCPNESSTLGVLSAMKKKGLNGKIHFVGFDATPREIEALKAGDVEALVAQNPEKMGYLAVQAAVDAIHGKTVAPSIDSGIALITKDNLDSPDIQKLLSSN